MKTIYYILVTIIAMTAVVSGCNAKSSVIVETIQEGNNSANCYIIGEAGKAAIIDTTNNIDELKAKLQQHKLVPEKILLTHGHFDHISGIAKLKQIYPNLKVYVHQEDAALMTNPQDNMSLSFIKEAITAKADGIFKHGDKIELGNFEIKVLHTPGHTPGSSTFQVDNYLFTGDTLLKGSVGRTDFPGGNEGELYRSIKDKLLLNPDSVIIYPGHGESSTLGDERKYFQQ